MKLIALAALFAATSAHAVNVATPGQACLFNGAGNGKPLVCSSSSVDPSCLKAAEARPVGSYTCKVGVTVTAAPACPAQPVTETRTQACATGTVGAWMQTRTYSAAPSPTCWAASAWSPATAPAGACVTPEPPPPTSTGSATLSWSAPIMKADGTTRANVAWYRVLYGRASGAYTQSLAASASPVIVPNLAAGTWFFAVTAVDAAGNESETSYEISKAVQ